MKFTIENLLAVSAKRLSKISPSPFLDAEVLLSFVLKKNREYLIINKDNNLTTKQLYKFNSLIKRRANGMPVAYLVGRKEFYGYDFFINRNVLIPRPETERLVELAGNVIKRQQTNIGSVIDVGTGSGCIIISLAKYLQTANRKLLTNFYATDASKKALAVAQKNARRHKVKIKFLYGNLLSPLPQTIFSKPPTNLIVANLPYLTPAEYRSNPDLKREPRAALIGGKDGLKYFRELFGQLTAVSAKKKRGRKPQFIMFLEHSPAQKNSLAKLINKYFPNASFKFHKDLSGKWRSLEIKTRPIEKLIIKKQVDCKKSYLNYT